MQECPAKAAQEEFELGLEGLVGFCQAEKTRREIPVMGCAVGNKNVNRGMKFQEERNESSQSRD